MANKSTWTGVKVFMSGAPAAAVPITTISKATEGVLSVGSTTGVSVGSYLLINSQGMGDLDGRVFRVKALVANTSITIEGEDTTNYDTFSSGSYQLLTFSNTLSTLTSVSGSGGEFDLIDTTTIHDKQKSNIPGMASALSYSFDSIWDVADAGLIAAKAASQTKAQRAFMLQFQNNQRVLFYGYIGTQLQPGGSTGGMVTTKVTITANGSQTNYAS